jgi:hypothetical protein
MLLGGTYRFNHHISLDIALGAGVTRDFAGRHGDRTRADFVLIAKKTPPNIGGVDMGSPSECFSLTASVPYRGTCAGTDSAE